LARDRPHRPHRPHRPRFPRARCVRSHVGERGRGRGRAVPGRGGGRGGAAHRGSDATASSRATCARSSMAAQRPSLRSGEERVRRVGAAREVGAVRSSMATRGEAARQAAAQARCGVSAAAEPVTRASGTIPELPAANGRAAGRLHEPDGARVVSGGVDLDHPDQVEPARHGSCERSWEPGGVG
jgi:hypothetical protein